MKNAVIRFHTSEPDYSDLPGHAYDWEYSVYGNVKEYIPKDCPSSLGRHVTLTHYIDANLFHDILTGRSVTGILHLVNQTPLEWFSKKQNTVETATYGSEFVAARLCVEQLIDLSRNAARSRQAVSQRLQRQGRARAVARCLGAATANLSKVV